MHKNKIDNILAFSTDERVEYFIFKICDFETVWGLSDNGWAMSENDNGENVISFWPEQDFAELCAIGPWLGYSPKPISLGDFLVKWIPGMSKDNVLVGVFQTPNDKSFVCKPEILRSLIEEELENY